MTRQEIYQTYKVRDGVIHSPGKFEAEAVYAPYFWEIVLCGLADQEEYHDGRWIYSIEIHPDDIKQFRELGRSTHVYVHEDPFGFVTCRAIERS